MKKYKIKKGRHSTSGLHFGITFNKTVKYRCSFDRSCIYKFDDVDKFDINKLCGFSTTMFHHKQSGRIGWRCLDNESIEILTYTYNDGVREGNETDVLGVVKPNQEFEVSITDNEEFYMYTFKDLSGNSKSTKFFDRKQKDWFLFHYLLFPFFGGNKTAPHDMIINLKRLK